MTSGARPPPKKKVKAKVKAKAKLRKKKAFTVTVSGDEARYSVSVLNKAELKRLRGKGLESETGLMTLSETLSGDEEKTWVSKYSVCAYVDDKEIPVHFKDDAASPLLTDHCGKNVVFIENTTNNAKYTVKVLANSVNDIRAEISLSEQWKLPDGRKIEIYSLTVFSPMEVDLEDLEYQGGGWGRISGELITADGNSVGLDEEEEDDTGEYRVKVSGN